MTVDDVAVVAESEMVAEPIGELPPISGFWYRLGAFVIDTLLLGLIGQIIGWTFSSVLFRVGPYGRFIGWIILLVYFGLLNSIVGKGQTVGKRLLKIAVRDSEGNPIGLGRSFLRAFVLTLPNMLNGWQLPIFQSISALTWIQAIIVFGVGGALVYTMIFNRGTRQGFHDLVCRTYVVRLSGEPVVAFPQVSRIHWIISTALICLSLVLVVVGNIVGTNLRSSSVFGIEFAPIQNLYETYSSDNRFFSVSVSDKATYSPQRSQMRILTIGAWYKGRALSEERTELMVSLVRTALTNYENINEVDAISITITSAYDIGIATGNIRFSETQTVKVWQQVLGQP
jgi:uncharacterized RDD family membrane protein YckC